VKRRFTRFYTPESVARQFVANVPLRRPALVVDPACGDGTLLAAVVAEHGASEVRLVGIDTSRRALAACKRRLSACGAVSVQLFHGDFLRLANTVSLDDTCARYVVMNPPFIGYKHLSTRERVRLKREAPGLVGRFNMADAFVLAAVSRLAPDTMMAILPASTAARLGTNGHLPGKKTWRRLPDSTFAATISTGVMLWSAEAQQEPVGAVGDGHHGRRISSAKEMSSVVVRNGVATGADAIFLGIASNKGGTSGGRIVRCARGREVAKQKSIEDLPQIWCPMDDRADATEALKKEEVGALRSRHCVRVGHKHHFAYHSAVPSWFLGTRKLIVPEICRSITILDDGHGRVLPLHSTLAIKTSSVRIHRLVKKVLLSPRTWTSLLRSNERMVGGAIRLTSGSLSKIIRRGIRRAERQRNETLYSDA
jgi:SAM-dependent methyltransferase